MTERIRDRILRTLGEHPLFSRRQLEMYLRLPGRSARQGLQELAKRNWIQSHNARQPRLLTRSLFAPTEQGIAELARQAGMPIAVSPRYLDLSPARLGQLILLMERVFQLRTLFLWLIGSPAVSRRAAQGAATQSAAAALTRRAERWRPQIWDVEVARFFSIKGKGCWIPFHGAAVMVRPPVQTTKDQAASSDATVAQWIPIVVEFDLGRVPVDRDRERLVRYVLAQDDPRFWARDQAARFPILVVIARDEFRLQDYYTVLQATAAARRLPLPRAYFTTLPAMLTLRQDPVQPIWYSTLSSRQVPLLFDVEGNAGPPPEQVPWRRLPLVSPGTVQGEAGGNVAWSKPRPARSDEDALGEPGPDPAAAAAETQVSGQVSKDARRQEISRPTELVELALALSPLAKELLDEIAAHPLLRQEDLALLRQSSRRKVRARLGDLIHFHLVEQHRDRYLLAPQGEEYLTRVAGFGHAVRRHARARGWASGYDALLRHFEHTQAENDFFLSLARIAQHRRHKLSWLSELEGRLYYEAGHRRHSFLPDGRGTYRAHGRRYEFAVEIDRSRMAQEKFRRKFVEYAACINSNVLRREGIGLLRVLVVTSSWERAEHLAHVAHSVASDLPVWFTTFDRLLSSGADGPIWLSSKVGAEQGALASPKTFCFECFEPETKARPPPNRPTGDE